MNKYIIPLLISIGFLIIGIFTLSDYGLGCDSAYHMLRGQGFAQIYLTGSGKFDLPDQKVSPIIIKPDETISRYYFSAEEFGNKVPSLPNRIQLHQDFIDQEKEIGRRVSFYESNAWDGDFLLKSEGIGHLPFVDILSAFSNRIFYETLGILGDIESYQLIYILISSLGVFIVSVFAYQVIQAQNKIKKGHSELVSESQIEIPGQARNDKLLSPHIAAFIAGISMALFPFFLSEAHTNMKDPLQASFFAGAIWGFWNWVRSDKKRWFAVFAICILGTLGIKWNSMFLPLILFPWLFFIRKTPEFRRWFNTKLIIYSLLLIISAFIFMVAAWPFAWGDPIGRIAGVLLWYLGFGTGVSNLQPQNLLIPLIHVNLYPAVLLFSQTPEVVIGLIIVAYIMLFRQKDNHKTFLLLSLWILIPLLRISLPPFKFYSGIRQIMEVLPAMAILAGLGGAYLISNFKFKIFLRSLGSQDQGTNLKWIFAGVVLILLIIPIMRLHPNESLYINNFAKVGQKMFNTSIVGWSIDSSGVYKEGAEWINKNAPKNSELAFLTGCDMAISPLWLRNDISFSPNHFSGFLHKGEYILQLFNPLDPPAFAALFPQRFLKPVHQIFIDGLPILSIYKNEEKNVKTGFKKEKTIKPQSRIIPSQEGDYIQIDLGKNEKVTKIESKDSKKDCLNLFYEYIAFIPENKLRSTINSNMVFALNERFDLGGGKIEYDFPAQEAHYINIYPQSEKSCFASGKIDSVSYLR